MKSLKFTNSTNFTTISIHGRLLDSRNLFLVGEVLSPVVLLLFAILYVLHTRYNTPLRKVPGPWLASITRLWKISRILYHHSHEDYYALHQKYGDTVRIGPNEVSLANPEAVKIVYGAGTKFGKARWYSVWNMGGDKEKKFDLFADTSSESHAANKRLVSNSFSAKSLHELEDLVDKTVYKLLRCMDDMTVRGEIINLSDWLQWFAFDVIGHVTFSEDFGFLEKGADIDGTLRSILEMSRAGIVVAEMPELAKYRHTSLFQKLPIVGVYRGKLNFLAMKARTVIQVRLQGKEVDRRDLLSRYFNVAKEHPERFNETDIQILSTLNIFAGSDTTSIALRAIIYYLTQNPRCIDKLLQELDNATKAGSVSDPITYAETQKLPYLQACIKEAMRLHPSIGHNQVRVVPEGGFSFDGKFLPEQTIVGINSYVMHRNAQVFGDRPTEYRPERWIEGDKPLMERHSMTFGLGAHLCIGKNIALLEINKSIPAILQRYKFRLANPENGGWNIRNYGFMVQNNFHVHSENRDTQKKQ